MIDPEQRVVTLLPLEELWSASIGLRGAHRLEALGREAVTELLRRGPVWFVVANVGYPLEWVKPNECFTFWKTEVQPHLVEPDQDIRLENYPGEYAYVADQWATNLPEPVVVLEKHH